LDESDDGVPVLSVRSLTGNTIASNEIDFVPTDKIRFDFEKHSAVPGDVLIASRSTDLATGIVPSSLSGSVFNSTLIAVRPREQTIHPRLLVAWMQSALGRTHFDSLSQSGTMQMNVTVKELSNLPVPTFSASEQAVLVAVLEASDTAHETAVMAATHRRDIALQLVTDVLIGKTKIKN
jgi:restriction endonuclease S subunit